MRVCIEKVKKNYRQTQQTKESEISSSCTVSIASAASILFDYLKMVMFIQMNYACGLVFMG